MNTEQFFSLVLPTEGLRCVAIPTSKGGFKHHFYQDNQTAAAAAVRFDTQGSTVYYAVASFQTNANRKTENAQALKTFIADIDCGPSKPYASKAEGAKEILAFCNRIGLTRPYIVQSGNGLHAYWPLDADLDAVTWKSTATLFKHVLLHAGVHADPSRTADVASVLRPVGTFHRKAEPKPVKIVGQGLITTHDDFLTALDNYAAANELDTLPAGEAPAVDFDRNSDLTGGRDYQPADAQLVADNCAVVGHMREVRGNCDQPTWYGSLGVVVFCDKGDKLAHAWSEGHPEYDEGETDTKIAQARKYKPTTCAKLMECQPALCRACPHFGKIKSPIALGYAKSNVVTAQSVVANAPAIAIPVGTVLPEGFRMSNDRLEILVDVDEDEDGAKQENWKVFCDSPFMPTARIRNDMDFEMELEMTVRGGELRRFTIPTALVGRGGAELASELAKRELVARPKMDHAVHAYLRRWMDRQRETADEVKSFNRFGWHDRNFLVGNTLFTPTGQKQIIVNGNAERKAPILSEAGDYEVWKNIINRLYNHPDMQPLQFLVLIAFASPLFAMLQEFGGVTVFAYSQQPGVGKTTAECAGLSAWGRHDGMKLANNKATTNALWSLVGMYHSLPVVYDEMTTLDDGKLIAEMIFSISDGSQKERCDSTGNVRNNNSNWRTIVSASGNNLLSEKLATYRANAEAEICRIFEYTIPKIPQDKAPVPVSEAASLVPQLLSNHGHAGREFIQYVVEHYDEVLALLTATRAKLNSYLRIQQSERFWSGLQASVFTALQLCKKLGILDFDTAALLTWVRATTDKNRSYRDQLVSMPNDQFGKLLTDIWSNVLVTLGEGDLRSNAEASVLQHPQKGQALSGRSIIPNAKDERAVLYLNANSVKDWCAKNGVSAKEIFDLGVSEGWINPVIERISLGKGTNQYASVSPQVRAWQIDSSKIADKINSHPIAKKMQVVSSNASHQAPATR